MIVVFPFWGFQRFQSITKVATRHVDTNTADKLVMKHFVLIS